MYISGLVLFILSSAACGMAPSIEVLVFARVFQGVGAATMMPGTLSIITQAFPPQQRGLAIGIWGGVSGKQRRTARQQGWDAARLLAELDRACAT